MAPGYTRSRVAGLPLAGAPLGVVAGFYPVVNPLARGDMGAPLAAAPRARLTGNRLPVGGETGVGGEGALLGTHGESSAFFAVRTPDQRNHFRAAR